MPPHHAAGQVRGAREPGLSWISDTSRGARAGAADRNHRAIARQLAKTRAELAERDRLRARDVAELARGLVGLAHVDAPERRRGLAEPLAARSPEPPAKERSAGAQARGDGARRGAPAGSPQRRLAGTRDGDLLRVRQAEVVA